MLRFTDNIIAQMTLGCNLHCPYCYEGDARAHHGSVMNYEKFEEAFDTAVYYRCVLGYIENRLNWHFHGGEVLTLPFEDLKKCIEHIEERRKYFPNLTYCMQTNGTLITEDMAKYFADINMSIGFSFDGYKSRRMSEEDNHKLIDKLRGYHEKYGTHFGALCVLSRDNMKTWADDIRSISDFIDSFGINPLCGVGEFNNLIMNYDEQIEYWAKPMLEETLKQNGLIERAIEVMIETMATDQLARVEYHRARKTGCFNRICGHTSNMTALTPEFMAYDCDKYLENGDYIGLRKGYNIKKRDFLGLQQANRTVKYYDQMFKLENELGCDNCPARNFCAGDCQSANISKFGHPYIDKDVCKLHMYIYDFFMEHWVEMLSNRKYNLMGEFKETTPYARDVARKKGYQIKIATEENRIYTEKI